MIEIPTSWLPDCRRQPATCVGVRPGDLRATLTKRTNSSLHTGSCALIGRAPGDCACAITRRVKYASSIAEGTTIGPGIGATDEDASLPVDADHVSAADGTVVAIADLGAP